MKRTIPAILALFLAFSLCGCGASDTKSRDDGTRTAVYCRYEEGGGTYLFSENSSYRFDTDLASGYITPDRTHIVTLSESGELTYSDAAQENTVSLDAKVESVSHIRNGGFFFTDEKGVSYRVRFGAEEPEKLGEDVRFVVAENTTSALYATGDGKLYTLSSDSAEPVKVGSFDDSVLVSAVSDSAEIAVWLLYDGSQLTPVILNGEDKKTCAPYTAKYYSGFEVEFSKDQTLAVMGSYNSNSVYIVKNGEEVQSYSFPDALYDTAFYSANGRIHTLDTKDISSVFVSVQADSGENLYCLTPAGDKERLLSNVQNAEIQNGRIVYIDKEGALYYAPVTASGMGEEKKISGDAHSFEIPETGSHLFFTKNYDDGTAALCAYDFKDGAVQKVSGNVSVSLYLSTDGTTVYYFKNTESVKDTYRSYGDLYCWTYSKKETEGSKIASDVLTSSLTSFLSSGELEKNGFWFERFNSAITVDGSTCVAYDLMKYDGKDAAKVQPGLYK